MRCSKQFYTSQHIKICSWCSCWSSSCLVNNLEQRSFVSFVLKTVFNNALLNSKLASNLLNSLNSISLIDTSSNFGDRKIGDMLATLWRWQLQDFDDWIIILVTQFCWRHFLCNKSVTSTQQNQSSESLLRHQVLRYVTKYFLSPISVTNIDVTNQKSLLKFGTLNLDFQIKHFLTYMWISVNLTLFWCQLQTIVERFRESLWVLWQSH